VIAPCPQAGLPVAANATMRAPVATCVVIGGMRVDADADMGTAHMNADANLRACRRRAQKRNREHRCNNGFHGSFLRRPVSKGAKISRV
jgi:hypothetical protein